MSRTSSMSRVRATSETGEEPPTSPAAARHAAPGWRDPRLAVGVAIVAVSVLLGARLFAGADDTVAVWAASRDLAPGSAVDRGDLVRRQVGLTDDMSGRYLLAATAPPAGATLLRGVGEGELLPRAALGAAATDVTQIPISAPAEAVPETVRAGSTVDVWVTAEAPAGALTRPSVKVFDDVPVVAAPRSGNALGPSAMRQVIIGVADYSDADLGEALARTTSGTILVTKQG